MKEVAYSWPSGEPLYDVKLKEWKAIAMTGSPVYGATPAECKVRLREANRVYIEHCQKCQEDRDGV